MRTRMVEVREGEYLGPVDWSYDFRQHDWGPGRGGMNPEVTARNEALLRDISEGLERGERWQATTDGGWPRVGWKRVLRVGMYDGWPHWRPVPSVQMSGPLGATWHPFYSLAGAEHLASTTDSTLSNPAPGETNE